MTHVKQLILASQSPFRRALLQASGVAFNAAVAPIDERDVSHSDPKVQARLRAEAKAVAVARQMADAMVIGADQVLGLDGQALGKVETAADAKVRLARMSGRSHTLHSAVTLAFGPNVLWSAVVDVDMPMRSLSPAAIDAYIATGEWEGSSGCYQFENRGVHLFEGVDRDHAAIIGLPLQPLFARLRAFGMDLLQAPKPPWTITLP